MCNGLWWPKNSFPWCFSISLSDDYLFRQHMYCHSCWFNTYWIFSPSLHTSIGILHLKRNHNNHSIYFFLRFSPSYFNCSSFISINCFKLEIIFKLTLLQFFSSLKFGICYLYSFFLFEMVFQIDFLLQFHPP